MTHKYFYNIMFKIIIIIPLKSTPGHRAVQLLAISFDLRLLAAPARRSAQIVTPPGGVGSPQPHYVYRDTDSTPELVYPSGCRFYG
jgi:hypothetical protein